MNIAADTKISTLIKENPASIEAIASISKHFEKLRNPVLRKILASRVTIADAARIGGCTVERFFEKLAPLGFEIAQPDIVTTKVSENDIQQESMPARLAVLIPGKLNVLDVREDIASNNDPFRKIMNAIQEQGKDKALLIINTFEPTPLLAILKKKGYDSFIERKEKNMVYTYFFAGDAEPEAVELTPAKAVTVFEEQLIRFAEKVKKIDVRNLEMPQPMITILQELEQLPKDKALYVNHKRVPQYLLPQIEERGFQIAIQEVEAGTVNLLIYK